MNKNRGITVTIPTSPTLGTKSPKSPLARRIKKSTKTQMNTKSRVFKEKDIVVIRIPEEMLIHGQIDPFLDNERGTVVSMNSSEAKVKLSNEETVSVPTFCLFNQ